MSVTTTSDEALTRARAHGEDEEGNARAARIDGP